MEPTDVRAKMIKRFSDLPSYWSTRPIAKVPRYFYKVTTNAHASARASAHASASASSGMFNKITSRHCVQSGQAKPEPMKLIEEPVDGVSVDPIVVAQPVENPVEKPASPALLIQPLPE